LHEPPDLIGICLRITGVTSNHLWGMFMSLEVIDFGANDLENRLAKMSAAV
jgi:hypothetical protein